MLPLRKLMLAPIALLLLVSACEEDSNVTDACNSNFNQAAMYENLADNLIIPLYEDLEAKVIDLREKAAAFVASPDETGLIALREGWKAAFLAWERAAPYEFGPAEDVFLRNSLDNFPLNLAATEQIIQSGEYDFDDPEAFTKGFPALDYLLFGTGNNAAAVVEAFTNGTLAGEYRQYLTALTNDISERVVQTREAWTDGGYREAFISNTGTAAGSALSLIVNNLNEHYETIKRDRIGIPSGILTLGFTNPDKVEAFYSGISAELALEATRWSRRLYEGRGVNGTDGPGLDDFLNEVNAEKNGRPLDAAIDEQYEAAVQAIAAIDDPLSEAVDQESAAVEAAYNELTKQVVNLKTDLPAVLCVSITYVDNPSDSD